MTHFKMKRILCAGIALIMLLAACSRPTQVPESSGSFTHGIYELTFSVERLSGWPFGGWDFAFICNGEKIQSGHRISLSLEVFSFYPIQVEVTERGNPNNKFSTTLRVPIGDGDSAATEITVTGRGGVRATFRITCQVTLVGKR